ncbi:ROK family protein [Atribacter laminatus]|uniref:N-acetylglucosamine repressor n=1 Tax=Atribacter laminatus TaxID=2847778 RepID=A0A7T1F384_ATRLM|nr:ROK family transcriptional regulator [Atribacter laminatus]QPM68155.1 N-acetylglucosamine repressor [Atribacter laminatus]
MLAVKELNAKIIFDVIKKRGAISRTEISRITNISRSTIGNYVDYLLEKKLIAEIGHDTSTGGRRARLLSINPDYGPSLGIEIGGDNIKWIITTAGGNIINSGISEMWISPDFLTSLNHFIYGILNSNSEIKSIGIASAGLVEYKTGISLFSSHRKDMTNLPIKKALEKKFNLPVIIDDVSRAFAFAEKKLGVAQQLNDFLYIYLDKGIGLSIIFNGELYRGTMGISGEIGHFLSDEHGPACGCGNRGCLEVVASCSAIVQNARKSIASGVRTSLNHNNITIENIIIEAKMGDKFCYKLINNSGEKIGFVLSQVINLLGIPTIVIGGCLKNADNLIIEPIKRMIREYSISNITKDLDIKLSCLDSNAGVMGAAILSLMEI